MAQTTELATQAGLNTQIELHAHINITRHLHDLGEVNHFLGCFLQICDREDLETGVVDLDSN